MTQAHTMKCSGLTILDYLSRGHRVAPSYFCVDCGEKVTDALNTRSKRCKVCTPYHVKMQRVYNSRIHNGKKKRFVASLMREASREYGIQYMNEGDPYNQSTRIDPTHTAWDYVPNGFKTLGTMPKSDLEIDEDGRIKGMVKLKREIERLRNKRG